MVRTSWLSRPQKITLAQYLGEGVGDIPVMALFGGRPNFVLSPLNCGASCQENGLVGSGCWKLCPINKASRF